MLTLVVGGDGDSGDPEDGKRKETNSGVKIEKVTIVDDSEEVAKGGNEGEAKDLNEFMFQKFILTKFQQ